MPQAILTIGIPACGKSTWALHKQATEPLNNFLELDIFREQLGDRHDQSLTPGAVQLRDHAIARHAAASHNLIIADTNLHATHRVTLAALLTSHGYTIHYEVFRVPLYICDARNALRHKPVPAHAMQRLSALMDTQF